VIPAVIPTTPSMPNQTSVTHDSTRTRPASAARSADPAVAEETAMPVK
jgi:hypothetical protein